MKWVKRKQKIKPSEDDTLVEKILKARGIKDVKNFLNPSEECLHDPYLLKNIANACNRILKAIKNGERIVVSYDPDADGLTSATMMIRYLKNYTDNVDYIYGERNSGHGVFEMITVSTLKPESDEDRIELNKNNTDKVREADLLILVDSSSNDVKTCKWIVDNLKTDIIILDHHECDTQNNHALIVNPQQEGCNYPNKFLSGAGVVFKVMQVMEDTLQSVDVWQYSDLLAVGMLADVMRMDILENRYLVLNGMRNLKNTGLIRICKGAKVDTFNGIKGNDIGFSIAPLINGVARMDNLKLAIDILLEDDDAKCRPIRLKMQKLNEERKKIMKEVIGKYQKSINPAEKVLFVLGDHESKGFNGLIAQQLSELYSRPVIVARLHKGELSGSFRSFNNFNLKDFFSDFKNVKVAGHAGAGGIELKEEYLDSFKEYIDSNIPDLDDIEQKVFYDIEIDVDEIEECLPAIEKLNYLNGKGFPKIIVKVNSISVESSRVIGESKETVKVDTFHDLELIKFRVNEDYGSELSPFDSIDVVGELSMNKFYNFGLKKLVKTPQIIISDYKAS